MKLPLIALAAALSASPAVACADDFLPGFMGHAYLPDMTAEEVEAVRQVAMELARQKFLASRNLTVDRIGPSPDSDPATGSPSDPDSSGLAHVSVEPRNPS